MMPFSLKLTQNKNKSIYKTLYLSEQLAQKIDQIASANQTSFNNVVISMIEFCLEDEKSNP